MSCDRLLLVVVGLVVAGSAWWFFRVTGEAAFSILLLFTVIAQGAEIRRLRRILEAHGIPARPQKR